VAAQTVDPSLLSDEVGLKERRDAPSAAIVLTLAEGILAELADLQPSPQQGH
jgi:hypothetical protein